MGEKKKYIFTIDDNIRFFRELTEKGYESLFAHPYTKLLKDLHTKFGVKIQLNCFFADEEGFNLSMMTERYKSDWIDASSWLKLSFHSRKEFPSNPYVTSKYNQVFYDCMATQNEIIRFAGVSSLAKTTTIHFCLVSKEGVKALKDCSIKGLLGLFGTNEQPKISYDCTESTSNCAREGKIVAQNDMFYASIDIILNLYSIDEIIARLKNINDRDNVKIMIHEQYFYSDYPRYQANFQVKLENAIEYLTNQNYSSIFFEETL